MSSALSKRQQARNEKQLHDLVQNVTGNNICADCQARNPGRLFVAWPGRVLARLVSSRLVSGTAY